MKLGAGPLTVVATIALLLTSCGADAEDQEDASTADTAEEASPSPENEDEDEDRLSAESEAEPDAEPASEPPPTFTEDELSAALLTADDFSEVLPEVEELEVDENGTADEDPGADMISGDDACLALARNEHLVSEDAPTARSSFGWDGNNRAYQYLRAYADVEELRAEEEAYLDLAADCQTAVYPGDGQEITEEYEIIDEDDLDSRYLDLGDAVTVRTITYSTESHNAYAVYLIAEIQVEHLLTTVGVSFPEQPNDDAALPLMELAVEQTEAFLTDAR